MSVDVDGCMMSHFSSLYRVIFQASWVFTAKFVAGIFQDHGNCGDSSFCCCLCQLYLLLDLVPSWQAKGLKQFRCLKNEAYAGWVSTDPSDTWG